MILRPNVYKIHLSISNLVYQDEWTCEMIYPYSKLDQNAFDK